MEYRQIGKSSLKSSVLGLGGLHFGTFCDQKSAIDIINRAIDLGINFIDSAPIYGNGRSEEFIKNAIAGYRDEIILSIKVGLKANNKDGHFGVDIVPITKENINLSLEKSLHALGTDYIDLYQVHAFDHNTPIEETMNAFDELIQKDKIKYIGCSNYDSKEFLQVKNKIDANDFNDFVSFQVHHNLIERKAEEEIIPLCNKFNISLIINRALARGILTGKYKVNQPLPENSRAKSSDRVRKWLDKDTLHLVEALEMFAKNYNRTAAELAIAWLLAKEEISTILIGARDIAQLENDIGAVTWKLSKNELQEVDNIINSFGLMSRIKARPHTFFEK